MGTTNVVQDSGNATATSTRSSSIGRNNISCCWVFAVVQSKGPLKMFHGLFLVGLAEKDNAETIMSRCQCHC